MRFRTEVFAVEDTSVQVTWRGAPAGPVTITVRAGDSTRRVEAVADEGPGAIVIEELQADTRYTLTGSVSI